MDKITLSGKEYYLVPVEEQTEKKEKAVEGYTTDEEPKQVGVQKAVGVKCDYRERFKAKKLTMKDITNPGSPKEARAPGDSELSKFNYKGDSLFFGEGVSDDYS